MKYLALAAAILLGPPASAQPSSPQPPAAAAVSAEPDPARLALARTVAQRLWPIGTYGRMMTGSMEGMMDGMMASMMDIKIDDVVPKTEGGKRPADAGMTMGEAMSKGDPHFKERMRIMNRVMTTEMVPLLSRIEPKIQDALARAYARKFSVEQLAEMNRFFSTQTGGAFAAESMMMFADPEMFSAMAAMAPEMMQAMPAIMAKVEAATAHLPPLPGEPKERGRKRK